MSATSKVVFYGENPGVRLGPSPDPDTMTTHASFWRTIYSPMGPGFVLFIQSDDFTDEYQVYSDNVAMAHWMNDNLNQGKYTSSIEKNGIVEATCESSGDPNYFWTETITSMHETIALTFSGIGDPLVSHREPGVTGKYGVTCTLVPCTNCRITLNGKALEGKAWPSERPDGTPWSTAFLAFAETWTVARL